MTKPDPNDPDAPRKRSPYEPLHRNPDFFTRNNAFFMYQPYIDAQATYLKDFVTALINRGTPMNTILGYALQNEQKFEVLRPPFVMTNTDPDVRKVKIAARTEPYDMDNADAREAAMNDSLVHWMNSLRAAVRSVHPNANVGSGFWNPYGDEESRKMKPDGVLGPVELRSKPNALLDRNRSQADFVDIHEYPSYKAPGTTFEAKAKNQALKLIPDYRIPRMMGEVGLLRSLAANAEKGSEIMRDWQVVTCSRDGGYFRGWIHWLHDPTMPDGQRFYDLEDPRDPDRFMANLLSPEQRPDPCVA